MTREEFNKYQYDALDYFKEKLEVGEYHIIEPLLLQTLGYIYDDFEQQLKELQEHKSCDGCISSCNTQPFYCTTCERLPRHDYYKPKEQ